MKAERPSPSLSLTNAAQFDESDEGGLNLSQVIAAIRRRSLVIGGITASIAALAAFKALTDVPTYQSQFELLTEPVTIETQVISSTNPQTLSSREDVIAVTADEVKLKILTSPAVMTPVVEQIQKRYPNVTYGSIIGGLTIATAGEKAEILTVSYSSSDRELVKDVLEVVAQAYLNYSLNTRQTGIRQGINFVEGQLPNLQSRVAFQQERLQKIRLQNNLVDPEVKGQQLSALSAAFGQQQLETQVQLNEAKSLYASLQKELSKKGDEPAITSILTANPRYQSLINQLLQIDSQTALDSALLLENSPELKLLRKQRQNLIPLIRQEGQRTVKAAADRIQELETRYLVLTQTLDRLNREVKQLSGVLRQYNDIQRELEIASQNLNQFLSKREALRIDAAQKEIPWRLLTPPIEPEESAASLKRNLIIGAALGLLVGIGVALALDKLINILYTSQDIKEATKLPILGVIPFEKELDVPLYAEAFNPVIGQGDRLSLGNGYKPLTPLNSSFFEAFRSLYTNIYLFNSESPVRSLVISSAAPANGRSTVALYLARAAASMGQRVLLVDTDLRDPSLHLCLQLTNERGLSDLLSEEIPDINEVIERSPVEDNLFVLTTGSMPLDPTRVLASRKMENLMEKLHAIFDLVVYKAPLLLGYADTHLLATHTDGVLLVTALGKLERSTLDQTLEQVKLSGTPVIGIVANRHKEAFTNSLMPAQKILELVKTK
jgi:polysaccharide biosynthesis transport protein